MSSSVLRGLLVRCLRSSGNIGSTGLPTCVNAAMQPRGVLTSRGAPRACCNCFNGFAQPSSSGQYGSPSLQQLHQQQRQCNTWHSQLPLSASKQLSCDSSAATAVTAQQQQQQQQQQQVGLLGMFHTSAAANKRINARETEDDLIEDELEVMLDEDEDLDLDEAEYEGEQLDDPEWIGDGGVATTRHALGSAGRFNDGYNGDDDDVGEYDVEFDEAWEDEEEVDDLRELEEDSSSSEQQHRSLRSNLAESIQSS